jgi:hypothetical protein
MARGAAAAWSPAGDLAQEPDPTLAGGWAQVQAEAMSRVIRTNQNLFYLGNNP